jgi:hypothetical protein
VSSRGRSDLPAEPREGSPAISGRSCGPTGSLRCCGRGA